MGLLDLPGLGFIKSVNFGALASGLGALLMIFFVIAVSGIIFTIIFYKIKSSKARNIKIWFFQDIQGRQRPTDEYWGEEVTIPNTTLKVFYIKDIDLFLPRGSDPMAKNHYWYGMLKNKEIVNFSIGSIDEELKQAKLNYDHRDMRVAYTYLQELIKRNYRDKAEKWWQAYKELISWVIIVFVMTLCFLFITKQIGNLLSQIGGFIEELKPISENLRIATKFIVENQRGSGIITG